MSRKNPPKHTTVTIALDPDVAAALDHTMIAFGLESRSQTAQMAVRAWLSAMMDNATMHIMCQQALEQVRKNEFAALADYYSKRAQEYAR